MAKFNSSAAVFSADSSRLLKLLDLDETTLEAWRPEDMAAMVRHQLSAPLQFDLSTLHVARPRTKTPDQTLTEAAAVRIRSFEDLLFHAEPPLPLLRLSKDFFKRRMQNFKKGSSEWQVAYLFYLVSILVAGVRVPEVSALTPGNLLTGIEWALSRDWVDDKTKKMIASARQRLQAKAAG